MKKKGDIYHRRLYENWRSHQASGICPYCKKPLKEFTEEKKEHLSGLCSSIIVAS